MKVEVVVLGAPSLIVLMISSGRKATVEEEECTVTSSKDGSCTQMGSRVTHVQYEHQALGCVTTHRH